MDENIVFYCSLLHTTALDFGGEWDFFVYVEYFIWKNKVILSTGCSLLIR